MSAEDLVLLGACGEQSKRAIVRSPEDTLSQRRLEMEEGEAGRQSQNQREEFQDGGTGVLQKKSG